MTTVLVEQPMALPVVLLINIILSAGDTSSFARAWFRNTYMSLHVLHKQAHLSVLRHIGRQHNSQAQSCQLKKEGMKCVTDMWRLLRRTSSDAIRK